MSLKFTDKLYKETKEMHSVVDRHPFVSLKNNKLAGERYINFNKICIFELQQTLKLKDVNLQIKLYRDIEQPDIFISDTLCKLLRHCKEFPLESAYQFYLGLLFGGNILKKMLPDHCEFLTYNNKSELILELKDYLNKNVYDQEKFINNVNTAYKLIKELFDELINYKIESNFTGE